jgi:hypothetical protein
VTLTLELWVEGVTDARTHSTWKRAEESDEPAARVGGVLIPLLRKALLAVEAWLLADAAAFHGCLGRGPKSGLSGEPESLPRPKEKLMSILDSLGENEDDVAALYGRLAEHVDVDTLAKRCPRGFGELRKALSEFIEPCL